MDLKELLKAQKNEITEHEVYKQLSIASKNEHNREILRRISDDEKRHYEIIKGITKKEVNPNNLRIIFYKLLTRIMGLMFSLKLMERGEKTAQAIYGQEKNEEIKSLIKDEERHEKEILSMLEDNAQKHSGAIVLGLNDALVELTGALAGMSLAIRRTTIIALTGLITGIAASLSMAASSYLSSREEKNPQAFKEAIYTGIAYIIVVLMLITPYLLIKESITAMIIMIITGVIIIALYNAYMSLVGERKFSKRFLQMTAISLIVAIISFSAGYLLRTALGIEV